ncbi:hypothetical protein [Metabacillus sediminilitoris]|uniref:Tubby C-terminal domain-containing protein n=1 Tax=Metabacillus sediminilitoris TaxID=2567941 RepID=A0A4S4BPZ7_9BACI|nr:hypothetical protein [Metabacillus sediminilitoris]QGQ48023.1 hypothetical protein GMB29_23840 [Metabacillus sediminilitoris]THF74666.1 hypothetical protein E6W99_24930 [Metabacillus sediminilitoris]
MEIYTFKKPILKKSTKNIDIIDSEDQIIGSIQRYFRNKFEYIVDQIFDELSIHVRVFDKNGDLKVNAQEGPFIKNFLKSKWDVNDKEYGEFQLVDHTKIKTNARLAYTIHNHHYKVEKDIYNKVTRIKDSSGKTICEITYDKPIPPKTITIKILSPVTDIYTIACIYYLFSLRD